jgi:hypothetical protein
MMAKNKSKKSTKTKVSKSKVPKIKQVENNNNTNNKTHEALDVEKLKEGIIESNIENRYDKLFEHKLAEQYKEFRHIKEHNIQMKKFVRVMMVIITIILVAVLLLTFG